MDLVVAIMPIQSEVGPVGLAYSLLFHKVLTTLLVPGLLLPTGLGYCPGL